MGAVMKPYIKERTFTLAEHILKTKDTIRMMAKIYSLSKSTVHNDLSKRLKVLSQEKYENVKKILDFNFSDKHIRGGKATKSKFEMSSKQSKEKPKKM